MKKIFAKLMTIFVFLFALTACNFSIGVNYNYPDADKYVLGSSNLEGIETINIDWISGKVIFVGHESGSISTDSYFKEEYTQDLTDDYLLHYYKKGKELNIKFAKSGANLNNKNIEKTLKIHINKDDLIKRNILVNTISADVNVGFVDFNDVNISTVSGDVNISKVNSPKVMLTTISGDVGVVELDTSYIDVSTISGEIDFKTLSNPTSSIAGMVNILSIDKANISTISGDTKIRGYNIGDLEFNSTSGNLEYNFYGEYNFDIDINTVSGNIKFGFISLASMVIDFDTTSGNFNSSFDVTVQNGKYIVKDGKNDVNVNTTSGNLTLDIVLLLD